ncbi:hypothetical protein [Streptomyces sp. CoH17]|uniref:hypothetical protein n=1 Tax=Streptomyces sp. CoH17 TaxID=2992806 RepID=UPI00226D80EE|nr:hypothetical protein [Streptomyces sp. CoH17]
MKVEFIHLIASRGEFATMEEKPTEVIEAETLLEAVDEFARRIGVPEIGHEDGIGKEYEMIEPAELEKYGKLYLPLWDFENRTNDEKFKLYLKKFHDIDETTEWEGTEHVLDKILEDPYGGFFEEMDVYARIVE